MEGSMEESKTMDTEPEVASETPEQTPSEIQTLLDEYHNLKNLTTEIESRLRESQPKVMGQLYFADDSIGKRIGRFEDLVFDAKLKYDGEENFPQELQRALLSKGITLLNEKLNQLQEIENPPKQTEEETVEQYKKQLENI